MVYHWMVWGFICLLGHYVHGLGAVEGTWNVKPDPDLDLVCDVHGYHYTVYTHPQDLHSVQFSGFDNKGIPMVISNSSDCGTSVAIQPGGSVLLQAAYDCCYSFEQVDHYAMPISIEYDHMSPESKVLQCPKLSVTVQCLLDGQMSITISNPLTESPFKLHSIHVYDGKTKQCDPILKTDELVCFKFPLAKCGTTSKEKDGKKIYENVIVADLKIREKTANARGFNLKQLRINIQCMLDPNDLFSGSDIPTPPSWLVDGLHLQGLQMKIAKDHLFQAFYPDGNHPVMKMGNNMIPIEVRISMENVESNMTFIVNDCWATPTRDPKDPRRWPIILNGCPFVGDNYESRPMSPMRSHSNRPQSHFRHLIIHTTPAKSRPSRMSLQGTVYFHCNASMVFDYDGNLCHKRRSKRNPETPAADFSGNGSAHGNANMTVLVSSHVPVFIPASEFTDNSGKGSPDNSGPLGHEWVRIAIVVSVLASLSMVWFIAKRKCKVQTASSENS